MRATNSDAASDSGLPRAARIAVIVTMVVAIVLLGSLFLYGVYNVVRTTPQEALGMAHNEETSGAYPLRALVMDSRRGLIHDLAPNEKHSAAHSGSESPRDVQYVLLLHGLKSTAELWLAFIEQWLQNARCNVVFVLPDLLGHGKSPWPPGDVPLNAERHVASLRALLSRVVPSNAALHIAGHSLGAQLSLALCANLLRYPNVDGVQYSVRSLTLMSAPYFTSSCEAHSAAERHSWWFRHKALAHICCGFLLCRQHWLWRPALRHHFRNMYPALPESVYEAAWQHSRRNIESCILETVVNHRPMQAAQTVRESGVPVLLIDGSEDKLCCDARKRLAADLAPFCTVVLLKGAGHSFVGTHVQQTAHQMRSFVEAIVEHKAQDFVPRVL